MATATLNATFIRTDLAMADGKPKTLSIKLNADVVESARIVSAYTGEVMADMLSDILRPILARMEQDEVAKRASAGVKRKPAK